jgi:hypothetical protein
MTISYRVIGSWRFDGDTVYCTATTDDEFKQRGFTLEQYTKQENKNLDTSHKMFSTFSNFRETIYPSWSDIDKKFKNVLNVSSFLQYTEGRRNDKFVTIPSTIELQSRSVIFFVIGKRKHLSIEIPNKEESLKIKNILELEGYNCFYDVEDLHGAVIGVFQ